MSEQPHEAAADEALRWMARKMSGSMTGDERTAFEAWLSRSAENRRALADIDRSVRRVDPLGDDLLAEEFERQLSDAAPAPLSRRLPRRAMAAAVAAAVFAVVATLFLRGGGPIMTAHYRTAVGEMRHVVLEDGSEIDLNTASDLIVTYNRASRSVALASGEAFFTVEKDRARPFVVKTPLAEIVVTGTAFSVSNLDGNSSVHVLTGVVDVEPLEGRQSTLLAGDMIDIARTGDASAVSRYDASLIFAWRNGKARFEDAPLATVVASLNRYFDTPITLGDESLADLPVTGEFDIRDRATAVNALALIFDLDAREEPARVVLSRPEAR